MARLLYHMGWILQSFGLPPFLCSQVQLNKAIQEQRLAKYLKSYSDFHLEKTDHILGSYIFNIFPACVICVRND